MTSDSQSRSVKLLVVSRVVGAVFGGYVFSAACVALLSVALPPTIGMERSESVILASMLGFLLYLGVLLWGFAEVRLARLWTVLGAGSALACALMLAIKALTINP